MKSENHNVDRPYKVLYEFFWMCRNITMRQRWHYLPFGRWSKMLYRMKSYYAFQSHCNAAAEPPTYSYVVSVPKEGSTLGLRVVLSSKWAIG